VNSVWATIAAAAWGHSVASQPTFMISSLSTRLTRLRPAHKFAILLATDFVMLPLCGFCAVVLSGSDSSQGVLQSPWAFVMVGLVTQTVLFFTGLYRSVVRFIDQRTVTRTAFGMAGVVALLYVMQTRLLSIELPHTVSITYWFVAFTYLMTSRFLGRWVLLQGVRRGGRSRRKTLVYGAGSAGVQLARAMSFSADYEAHCFADDSPSLHRKLVSGLPVYSPTELVKAIDRHDIDQIVVAIPSAPASVRQALIRKLEPLGLPVKTLPGLVELVDEQARLSAVRDVQVTDLLGRDPVPPDPALFARNLRGKVVLVTGAGGSIGGELCRQILSQAPLKVILLDHSEISLYNIEQQLTTLYPGSDLVSVLGSVLDTDLVSRVLSDHKVQTVYHAAAYKHVPIVESNVRQGIRNNVFGTLTLVQAARRSQVETCILVSTDKAVRPTNVMGASKRVAELIFQAAAAESSSTVFSMVRFGNVLGSSGSVVPLFNRQIQSGGPVTITHPDIIRYFMLIPEAAQLVIQAGAMARGGEAFVLDMGEPVRIADLARRMIRLAGLVERTDHQPDGDIEIQFVGLRPGEKLFEELLIGDRTVPSGHPRILCALEHHIEPQLLEKMLSALQHACDQNDHDLILRQLRNLVPDYRPAQEVNASMVERRRTPRSQNSTASEY
jgi:FlaA1/EpsC-like NDP-sugar epimerase